MSGRFITHIVCFISPRGLLWGRVLTERRQRSRCSVQLSNIPLPPDQQGVIHTCSTYLSNWSQVTFQFKLPQWHQRRCLPTYLVAGLLSHSNLSSAGGASQPSLKRKVINPVESGGGGRIDDNDDDAPQWVIFGMSLKGGEDTKEVGEGELFHHRSWGGLFLPKQNRACWTLFLIVEVFVFWIQFVSLFVFIVLYICVFLPTVRLWSTNLETISAWSGDNFPMHAFLFLKTYTVSVIAVRKQNKWRSARTTEHFWHFLCSIWNKNRVKSCNITELHSVSLSHAFRQSATE